VSRIFSAGSRGCGEAGSVVETAASIFHFSNLWAAPACARVLRISGRLVGASLELGQPLAQGSDQDQAPLSDLYEADLACVHQLVEFRSSDAGEATGFRDVYRNGLESSGGLHRGSPAGLDNGEHFNSHGDAPDKAPEIVPDILISGSGLD
jgi:hypothetical protein